jgi:ArsR family transcriptional regulator
LHSFAFVNITTSVLDATLGNTSFSAGFSGQRWELYRLLSEPVRLRLLALAAEEELAIGELADLLGESQPNVSRHAAPLKQAGLLSVRKQGTRALVRLGEEAAADAVVREALASGRALCEADGSLARIGEVLRARDAVAREFFARTPSEAKGDDPRRAPEELGAYLSALAPLLAHRALAVDAGTGDGSLLDVLAPTFERVVAIDRSEAQLARARERVQARGFDNVLLVEGDLDGPEVKKALRARGHREVDGADAVFAVRLLHHAARPAQVVHELASLCRPGGALVVIDYGRHDDESMREQADLWLGFDHAELRQFARAAGLEDVQITAIPGALCGRGPDAHLPWLVMVAHKGSAGDAADPAKPPMNAETKLARKSEANVTGKTPNGRTSRRIK